MGGAVVVWGLTLSLIAGIDRRILLFAIAAGSIFAVSLKREKSIIISLCLFLTACLFFSYGLESHLSYERRSKSLADLQSSGSHGQKTMLEGWVSSFPKRSRGVSQFHLRTSLGIMEADVLVRCNAPALSYGDSVVIMGKWMEEKGSSARIESRQRYYRGSSIMGVFLVDAAGMTRLNGKNGSKIRRSIFWPLHNILRNVLVRNLGDKSSIPLALLLGEKQGVSRDSKKSISSLGISHLFALSGLHLGLVLGVVLALMNLLGIRSKLLVAAATTLYVGTVGNAPSLHRAYTMVMIALTAKCVHRPIQPMTALGDALLILLLISPGSIYSVGFQFSFLATFAVLLCLSRSKNQNERRLRSRVRHYIVSSLRVSTFAQIFLAPLLLLYFGNLSLISPIATLVFLPLIFLMLVFAALCSFSGMMSPALGAILCGVMGRYVDGFTTFLIFVAGHCPVPLQLRTPSLWLYYGGLAVIFWTDAGNGRRILGGMLTALAFLSPHLSIHDVFTQIRNIII